MRATASLLLLLATVCAAQQPCTVVPGPVLRTTDCAWRQVPCTEMAWPQEWPVKDTVEWRFVQFQVYQLNMRPNVARCRPKKPLGVGVRVFDCVPTAKDSAARSPLQMPRP